MPRKSAAQQLEDNRLIRLEAFTLGELKATKTATAVVRRGYIGKAIEPNVVGLRDRTRTFQEGRFLPKDAPIQDRIRTEEQLEALSIADAGKVFNVNYSNILAEKAADYIGTYYKWNGILAPEYDIREPKSIMDTEVYVKQMVTRKKALAARAGYEIISERQEDADYIQNRIDVMEFVSGRTFESLIDGILEDLFTTSNCFLHKLRNEDASPVPKKDKGRIPVAAYVIIPAHTLHPYLKDGKIVKWRRFFDSGMPFQDIPVEDVIHLTLDRKPGHIYGTPRTVAVRDDIFALRRLEENIELLFINHLFPLFHVQVGTPEAPCSYGPNGESEIDLIRWQIENMPKEGVFVTDERVKVTAVGAEGKSLDTKDLVQHYKSRVYIGLGMSAIDMGEGDTATRSTADNISQNLKDSIKADLDSLAGQIRMNIFRDWFIEANYSTSVQKGVARTALAFHELDLDNRIKEETHVMALFNSHLITLDEARKRLKHKPMSAKDLNNTHFVLHVLRLEKEIQKYKTEATIEIGKADVTNQKALASTQIKVLEAQGALSEQKAGHEKQKLAAQAKRMPVIAAAKVAVANASARKSAAGAGAPRGGTAKKSTQVAKTVSNKMRPTNQHGTNLGPTKAKSALERVTSELYQSIADRNEAMKQGNAFNIGDWHVTSAGVIDRAMAELDASLTGDDSCDSYTRQVRDDLSGLKSQIAEVSDPELLDVLLREVTQEKVDNVELAEYISSSRAA